MKVLFTNNPPLIKYGLAEGFRSLGHETKVVGLWQITENQQKTFLQQVIEEFQPDFVLTEGHAVGVKLSVLFEVLKDMQVPLVYWATEDPVLYTSFSRIYASQALLTLTTTAECVPGYLSQGFRADTLLFGCNPDFHRQVEPAEEYCHDIVLVASNYNCRYHQIFAMVHPLVEHGFDIKVWGPWWDDEKRPTRLPDHVIGELLPYELLPRVYSSSKIVLGVHAVETSRTQTSMRTYEALGCGAFYLTYYTPAHAHLFEPGRHLVCSSSAEETVRLVTSYLADNEARRRIARQGQQLVYERDTYTIRAKKVIDLVSALL